MADICNRQTLMVFDLEDKMNINEKFSELIDQFYTIEKNR